MITTDGLTKEYSAIIALSNLHLAIPEGHVYGFIGPNGRGTHHKSHTNRAHRANQRHRPRRRPTHTNRQAVIPHIGYLPESPPIYDELTGREQLEYHGGLRDMDPAEIEDRIEEWIDRFDLTADADD